jgi:hypothetical protein
MELKRHKVVMLPSKKQVSVGQPVLKRTGTLIVCPNENAVERLNGEAKERYTPQHLYLISEDLIKLGDWCLHPISGKIKKSDTDFHTEFGWKKIIATTDKLPIGPNYGSTEVDGVIVDCNDYLPHPSNQFITKFVSNYNDGSPITDVSVEYDVTYIVDDQFFKTKYSRDEYMKEVVVYFSSDEIHKLKINPFDNTITIRKTKNEWCREELTDVIEHYLMDNHVDVYNKTKRSDIKNWVDELL